jgi:hypothetical protein
MEADWLRTQSYQHLKSIVSAINDLSLGLKLAQRGATTPDRERATSAAREQLASFLKALEPLTVQARCHADQPVVGASPGVRELAEAIAQIQRGNSVRHGRLRAERIEEIRALLGTDDPAGQRRLLDYLGEFRTLLQHRADIDAEQIVGDL